MINALSSVVTSKPSFRGGEFSLDEGWGDKDKFDYIGKTRKIPEQDMLTIGKMFQEIKTDVTRQDTPGSPNPLDNGDKITVDMYRSEKNAYMGESQISGFDDNFTDKEELAKQKATQGTVVKVSFKPCPDHKNAGVREASIAVKIPNPDNRPANWDINTEIIAPIKEWYGKVKKLLVNPPQMPSPAHQAVYDMLEKGKEVNLNNISTAPPSTANTAALPTVNVPAVLNTPATPVTTLQPGYSLVEAKTGNVIQLVQPTSPSTATPV